MKKQILVLVLLILAMSLFGTWQIDEPVLQNYSWTDSNGERHSIHELTEAGKAIVIFWGEDW